MRWDGAQISVRNLVTKVLLPIARQGLEKCKINQADIDKFLGVIEARANGITGGQWQVASFRELRKTLRPDDALLSLTKTIYKHQRMGIPVHEWPLADT